MTLNPKDGETYALARAIFLARPRDPRDAAVLSARLAWDLAEAFVAEAEKRLASKSADDIEQERLGKLYLDSLGRMPRP